MLRSQEGTIILTTTHIHMYVNIHICRYCYHHACMLAVNQQSFLQLHYSECYDKAIVMIFIAGATLIRVVHTVKQEG